MVALAYYMGNNGVFLLVLNLRNVLVSRSSSVYCDELKRTYLAVGVVHTQENVNHAWDSCHLVYMYDAPHRAVQD